MINPLVYLFVCLFLVCLSFRSIGLLATWLDYSFNLINNLAHFNLSYA